MFNTLTTSQKWEYLKNIIHWSYIKLEKILYVFQKILLLYMITICAIGMQSLEYFYL